ncbi:MULTISPECIES: hypothetical protein [Streptomyces]|uniref:hypothetical protein n=1 Tax=Streptomyces TaxID=1883 RepID=UPI0015FFBA6F|nr:hypothetical protein [Streptomyces murinus]MBA9050194.1 hypothetical protein [Streptomyces murinus]
MPLPAACRPSVWSPHAAGRGRATPLPSRLPLVHEEDADHDQEVRVGSAPA